jgi:hypothetical protein
MIEPGWLPLVRGGQFRPQRFVRLALAESGEQIIASSLAQFGSVADDDRLVLGNDRQVLKFIFATKFVDDRILYGDRRVIDISVSSHQHIAVLLRLGHILPQGPSYPCARPRDRASLCPRDGRSERTGGRLNAISGALDSLTVTTYTVDRSRRPTSGRSESWAQLYCRI